MATQHMLPACLVLPHTFLSCIQALPTICCNVQSASAAVPAQLAPPPPPPIAFASNTNSNGGSTAGSSGSYSSTIGDVFTYEPKGGGAIEAAGPVGPSTTALTVKNGKCPSAAS